MGNTQAIMFTMTTYGTWLRGDQRGWVSEGIIYPPEPELEASDRRRMKHPVFLFDRKDLFRVGEFIGNALKERLQLAVYALTVQIWHVHIVVPASKHRVDRIVKCIKDSVRWGLLPGRPIWTTGYDKRFCFDDESVRQRIEYVERHNIAIEWPARPWPFIEMPDF